jgi:LmbE family N-acetylglucosaminyl deacetylase
MAFSSALVLFAHPDDAEFMCGGTIARWTREGCQVHYVIITDGSAGSNEPGVTREELRPIREREQRAAAEVLGVKSLTFLGEVDGMLEVTLDTRRKVTREVRRLRPEVIVAPDPSRLWSGTRYINHSDHKAAGMLALEREENAFGRLVRGLISRSRLVIEKIGFQTVRGSGGRETQSLKP